MRKATKIILIVLVFLALFNNVSFGITSDEIWDIGKEFIDLGVHQNGGGSITMNSDAKDKLETLIDFLWGIGLLAIFISSIILGIKYMLVNPNEKSRIKQATTPYVIGVVIIFGALTIWKLLITILDGNLNS